MLLRIEDYMEKSSNLQWSKALICVACKLRILIRIDEILNRPWFILKMKDDVEFLYLFRNELTYAE